MGVTVLQQYPVPENKTGTYVIDMLTKRLLALGATQQGQFLVDCESYLSLPQMGPTKTVHVLHNSEQPASVFSILESGSKNIHVVADSLFDLLMMKLSNIYTSKKQTKMESKGTRFELGDFCVKLGSVTMNQSFKGVLVEVLAVELDVIDCGIDHELDVTHGDVEISQYPWLGVLYYSYYSGDSEARAVTTVALIQAEFVIAPAADIGPMPKLDFRENSRVLLGERWGAGGRRVRNFVLHPEYGDTCNTVALVQLRSPVRNLNIRPLCPPPERLRNPEFYVVKFKEGDDYNILQKQVVPVTHVPPGLCREFYLRANLYAKKMRPPHVACAVSLEENVCVWDAGAALVVRDVWGRWQLLGMSVRGPGCGAPSRFLDMMSYYPWVESSLSRFRRISISKISKQKYIMRTGDHAYQKFGNCDEGEKINLVFREMIVLRTDNMQYQFLTYNLTVYDNVEFSCLTMELLNASAASEMRIHHHCVRRGFGVPCYRYKGSVFEISVYLMFSESCRFEMFAWGWKKNMTLLDIQEWKWEEGTYYEDFTAREVEYRGPTHQTLYGFEPLDESMWVPEYDVWSTTPPPDPNATTTTRRVRSANEQPSKPDETTGDSRLKVPIDTLPPPTPVQYMTGKPNPRQGYRAPTTRAHG